MPLRRLLCLPFLLGSVSADGLRAADAAPFFLRDGETVVFFGDSITQAGGYIVHIEAWLRANRPDAGIHLINLGLGSETVTGLTEPDHPFPRPNVHERLDRALEKVPFDTAFVCYGMNDGIYHPFSAERFTTYQIGLLTLVEKLRAAGKRVVVMTPPPFEPAAIPSTALADASAAEFGYKSPYRRYDDEVIGPYGKWILTLRDRTDLRIDLHTPLRAHSKRNTGDGVHPTPAGHGEIARTILAALGVAKPMLSPDAPLLAHVTATQSLLGEAYRLHVGHKRPGERPNAPKLDAALRQAKDMEAAFQSNHPLPSPVDD